MTEHGFVRELLLQHFLALKEKIITDGPRATLFFSIDHVLSIKIWCCCVWRESREWRVNNQWKGEQGNLSIGISSEPTEICLFRECAGEFPHLRLHSFSNLLYGWSESGIKPKRREKRCVMNILENMWHLLNAFMTLWNIFKQYRQNNIMKYTSELKLLPMSQRRDAHPTP